jgi:ketosteroid isomerase-like protein
MNREILRAMSEENIENLRAFLEAASGPITTALAAWKGGEALSLLDPDVTYEDANLPDHAGETYRGHEGVIRATERWAEPYEELTAQLDQIVGTGDRLVSIHRVRAKARHTGIEFEGSLAYVWIFQSGKVTHFRSFVDPQEALEAAGLEE